MAIGFYFAPAALSTAQYNESISRLRKAGAGHPAGRQYHAAFGPPDKLMVFEVFTSQAAFEKFGKTLMPILQELGIDPGQPTVMPMHKVIVPPAGAAKKATKKVAAKRSAPARRRGAKKR